MPQVVGDLGRQRQVGDDLLFGHVDDQARPFLELRAIGLHDIGNRDLDQRVDRDVDGGPQIDAELGEVEGSLERLCQRLLGQGDEVRFRCARQECAGHEHAAVRVPGTGERFDADELLLAQIDLRLIPELDPAVAQRLIESDAAGSRRRMAELASPAIFSGWCRSRTAFSAPAAFSSRCCSPMLFTCSSTAEPRALMSCT